MNVPTIKAPHGRDEIAAEFERIHREGTGYWDQFSTDDFFAPLGTAWSPSDNVRHLLKSTRPVVKALSVPRALLWIRFGRSRRPSITFEQLRARYGEELAAGGKAGPFAPSPHNESDLATWRTRLMADREQVYTDLRKAISGWPDAALDRYQLPHPLLGNLTMREMLFFTLYHHVHHMNVVERRRAMSA